MGDTCILMQSMEEPQISTRIYDETYDSLSMRKFKIRTQVTLSSSEDPTML